MMMVTQIMPVEDQDRSWKWVVYNRKGLGRISKLVSFI